MAKRRPNGDGSIYRRKDGRWIGQLSMGTDPKSGEPIIKYVSAKTQKEAISKLNELKKQKEKGIVFTKDKKLTFEKWLDVWLNEYHKFCVAPRTYSDNKYLIEKQIKPGLGKLTLAKLQTHDIQQFYNSKNSGEDGKKGLSYNTIRLIHNVIKSSLNQAVQNRLIPYSPAVAVKLPKRDNKETKFLTVEEEKTLLEKCTNPKLKTMIIFSIYAGVRRGELLGLKWDDINEEKGTVTISRAVDRLEDEEAEPRTEEKDTPQGKEIKMVIPTKLDFTELKTSSSYRTIPLPVDVLDELKRHKIRQKEERLKRGVKYHNEGLIFCTNTGGKIEPRNYNRALEALSKEAKLPVIHPHCFRHTYCVRLIEAGVHVKVIQELLGHKSPRVGIEVYSHATADMLKEAINQLSLKSSTNKKEMVEQITEEKNPSEKSEGNC